MQNDTQLATLIIKVFLGMEWLEKHFSGSAEGSRLFAIEGTIAEQNLARVRIVDLAESLLNLCRVGGFNNCIKNMRTADNPESSLAELHIGKMLFANDWPFRFIAPQGKRGDNYDLSIRYENIYVCADVKCKIESSVPDSKTITNTLKDARTQLPADKADAFFVKIPQRWMEHVGWERITIQGATDFFDQGTGRIASVALYAEPIQVIGNLAQQGHHFYEITNPRRRFGQHLDWKFFQRWRPPVPYPGAPSWNAMPPKYIRLFGSPKGLIGHENE